MKKILIVGEFSQDPSIYTYATSFVKGFKKLGYEVKTFNNKKIYASHILPCSTRINNFLINFFLWRKVAGYKPDIVFILKGENIWARTLRCIKKSGAKLINFFPDNPFIVWNGNSSADLLCSLPLYDTFLIWSQELISVLHTAGAPSVKYFPFGFDLDCFYKLSALSDSDYKKYQNDVSFVGTWEPEREAWLTRLIQKQPMLNLGIWGNLWAEKLAPTSVLRSFFRGDAVYGQELLKIFTASKIVLNFLRQQNFGSHNMRTIEVLAVGAFLLTQRSREQAELLFTEGEHLACFADAQELLEKITYYLEHDDERMRIADSGFNYAQRYALIKLLATFEL